MIIKREMSLQEFEAWSGAVDTYNYLSDNGLLDDLESILEVSGYDEMTDTELNDLLWFESDWIYEMLNIRTYDQINQEIEDLKQDISELKSELIENEKELMSGDPSILDWIHDVKLDIDFKLEQIDELEEEMENAPV